MGRKARPITDVIRTALGKEETAWHEVPFVDNDRKINNYTTAVVSQWLSRDHVGTPTDINGAKAQQQMNGVLCAVRAEKL
jgi:hypothetical protein